MTIHEAAHLLLSVYPFDAEHYPELAHADQAGIDRFALRHIFLHLSKSLGKIATHLEALDHGDPGNVALLEEGMVKLQLNLLQLANRQKIDVQTLLDRIPEMTK